MSGCWPHHTSHLHFRPLQYECRSTGLGSMRATLACCFLPIAAACCFFPPLQSEYRSAGLGSMLLDHLERVADSERRFIYTEASLLRAVLLRHVNCSSCFFGWAGLLCRPQQGCLQGSCWGAACAAL